MQTRLLKKIKSILEKQQVDKAWLFGSYSRSEENGTSDIDIMVRFSKPKKVSLLSYINLINCLSDATGKKIDLVEEGQLKDFALENFEKEKIVIYERKTERQGKIKSYSGSH